MRPWLRNAECKCNALSQLNVHTPLRGAGGATNALTEAASRRVVSADQLR